MTSDRAAAPEVLGGSVGAGRLSTRSTEPARSTPRVETSAVGDDSPSWLGDVALGVEAWAGAARPTAPPPREVDPEADHESVARKILLDALTGRAMSRAELRDKLAKKNVPGDIAERLLDRFEEVGLVDDAAFAQAWVSSRQAGKGLAPRALAQELRRKGIDDEVAREALSHVDLDDQIEAARALVRRQLRSVSRLDAATATRRLVGMLGRKGYGSGLAFRVVKEELGAAGDVLDSLDDELS